MATALVESRAVRALLFRLAGRPFAVEVHHAREVVLFERWTVVPAGPERLLGVANLRGYVVPIFSIQGLLGLPPRPPVQQLRALVIAQSSSAVSVAIEETLGLESFDEVLPCSEATRREYGEFVRGLVEWGGGLVPLLDPPEVLAALRSGPGQAGLQPALAEPS
jgi:purine-binding chemotaxis protein CheW